MTNTTSQACRKRAAPHAIRTDDIDRLTHSIADTLRQLFPDCADPDELLTIARESVSAFAKAKVPNYVPILARKQAIEICNQRHQQTPPSLAAANATRCETSTSTVELGSREAVSQPQSTRADQSHDA